jgi:acyl-CoA thioesterase
VEAEQDGEPVLALMASFHVGESGDDWQPPHDVGPHPDSLPRHPSALDNIPATRPFDLRPTCPPSANGKPALHPLWLRDQGSAP